MILVTTKHLVSYLGTSVLLIILTCSQSLADNILQGGVQTQNYLPGGNAPGLSRQDISKLGDPFSGNHQANVPVVNQTILPPEDAFDMQQPSAPAKRDNLQAEINQDTTNNFTGVPLQSIPDIAPQSPVDLPSNQAPYQANAESDQADPDNTPDMQLAWDQWHRRLATAIYQRFNVMSQMAFKYSRPLATYVTYVVTRDGQITNVELQQKSPNIAFNTLLLLVIKSLSGQRELLKFPDGSKRMSVDKGAMFTQNYGTQGFKYTTGDKETIHSH